VPLPLGLGGIAIPTARITPANAIGTVQFKDGTSNLGGPVPVVGGIAVGPVTVLGKGQHQLTAIFTPTNPSKFTLHLQQSDLHLLKDVNTPGAAAHRIAPGPGSPHHAIPQPDRSDNRSDG
jgi:hypothetical protein